MDLESLLLQNTRGSPCSMQMPLSDALRFPGFLSRHTDGMASDKSLPSPEPVPWSQMVFFP